MNNREKGIMLEKYVAECLQEVLRESPAIRPTKASSGGEHNCEIGDIMSSQFFVECKNNEENWFKKKVWETLLNDMPFGSEKVPLYVIEDAVEGKLVMLSFSDFCKLLKEKND